MSEGLQEQVELLDHQDAEFPVKQTLVEKIKNWRLDMGERWAQLHTNQVIYVIALVLFFTVDGELSDPNTLLWLVGLLAFFGMARELWAIFIKIWESTFGRLVLLVVYAAIANLTLAVASQKVNIVIGADPTQLYHTLGVTTLLVLPLWIMIVSVVAMIVIFGLMQILRLLKGLLVLMRIIGRKKTQKEAFPKTFIIVRLILLLPVCMTMLHSLKWYSEQLNLPQTSGFGVFNSSDGMVNKQVAKVSLDVVENQLQKENISEPERQELLQAKEVLEQGLSKSIEQNKTENLASINDASPTLQTSEVLPEQTNSSPSKTYIIDQLIASFVYNYEAFEFSHCQKGPDERSVYISENDILVVKKDENAPNGYFFSTRSCHATN